jgi:hypothetical protein
MFGKLDALYIFYLMMSSIYDGAWVYGRMDCRDGIG